MKVVGLIGGGPVIVATQKLGAAELLFDVRFSPGVEAVDDIVARAEQLWHVAKQS